MLNPKIENGLFKNEYQLLKIKYTIQTIYNACNLSKQGDLLEFFLYLTQSFVKMR